MPLSTGPNGSSPEELQVKEEELRVRRIESGGDPLARRNLPELQRAS